MVHILMVSHNLESRMWPLDLPRNIQDPVCRLRTARALVSDFRY